MGRNRFVDTDTTRLDLSDGDWIEVKNELSTGEKKRLEGSPLSTAREDKNSTEPNAVEMGVSWDRYFLMKLELYIVDWSLRDKKNQPVKVSREAIFNLKDEDAEEMQEAIKQHEAKMDGERKNRSGVRVLETNS